MPTVKQKLHCNRWMQCEAISCFATRTQRGSVFAKAAPGQGVRVSPTSATQEQGAKLPTATAVLISPIDNNQKGGISAAFIIA